MNDLMELDTQERSAMLYDAEKLRNGLEGFKGRVPFDHCVIDGFLKESVAKEVEKEFIAYEDPRWFYYQNAIEDKKALNDWNQFPALTYKLFRALISEEFINFIAEAVGAPLYQDPGLHGGGWHIHGTGGNLNPHLDYSMHPKVALQRKINIIVYLSSKLEESHGGHLGLWTHDPENNCPGELASEIQPKFNRAVIFDTTQNSWHGMSRPLVQPEGIYRKSLAVYYLMAPPADVDTRERALFSARETQKGDAAVEALIRARADSKNFASVYRTEK